MFQNRRTVFLFVCSIVFVQAIYYIVTLQINKTQPANVNAIASLVPSTTNNQSSDRQISITQHSQTSINTSNLTQTNDTKPFLSTTISPNSTLYNSTLTIKINSTNTTTTTNSTTATTISINTTQTTPVSTTSIPFLNASFDISFNFTKSDPTSYNSLPICNFSITNNETSIYKIIVNQTLYPYHIIEQRYGSVLHSGGHYIPKECRSEQRLALIVCYRNREQHLRMFLDNIHPFLQKQQLDYTVFIVNQGGTDQFNRAALFNVGYLEAVKLYPYDCFIFHDVDLLPEDLRNVYKCGDQPRHMSVGVDKFNYQLLYSTLFGGVTAFRLSDFLGANGYPTVYWGWGGEDDDMYSRVIKQLKKHITRYPIEIARYKMIRTHDHISSKENPHRHKLLYSKYDYTLDGINTTNYTLHNVIFYKLFTLINVTLSEEPFEQIRNRLRIKKK